MPDLTGFDDNASADDTAKPNLSEAADTETPTSVTDFMQEDDAFDAYQALVDNADQKKTSQDQPEAEQDLDSGLSLGG